MNSFGVVIFSLYFITGDFLITLFLFWFVFVWGGGIWPHPFNFNAKFAHPIHLFDPGDACRIELMRLAFIYSGGSGGYCRKVLIYMLVVVEHISGKS